MKFLFTNIIGNFVIDEQGKLIDFILITESPLEKAKEVLVQKHKQVDALPKDKSAPILAMLRNKKYHSLFYEQNLSSTKKGLRESVSKDLLIMQAIANINELDKVTNLLAKRFREWYSLYFPEVVEKISAHEKLLEVVRSEE